MRVQFVDQGQGNCHEVAAAFSVISALKYQLHTLIMNEDYVGYGIEAGLEKREAPIAGTEIITPMCEFGWDALIRLSSAGRLNEHNFKDCTIPLQRGRLELLSGRRKPGKYANLLVGEQQAPSKSQTEEELIYCIAERNYELIVHSSSAFHSCLSRGNEGIHVFVVHQNRTAIQFMLEHISAQSPIVIYNYDPYAKLSINNIKRQYRCANPIYGIPYDRGFVDAWNNNQLIQYLRREVVFAKHKTRLNSCLQGIEQLTEGLQFMMNPSPTAHNDCFQHQRGA